MRYGAPNTPNTVYTGLHFAAEWRDRSHFAELDEAQIDAGIELTLDICRGHEIDPVFHYPSTSALLGLCSLITSLPGNLCERSSL